MRQREFVVYIFDRGIKMIFEIPEHRFATVQPLLMKYGLENHPIIQAIVQRFNRGKIYADQLEQPKTAAVIISCLKVLMASGFNRIHIV
jgi:hypothetical protein